jgi:pilus assembly protein CpaE
VSALSVIPFDAKLFATAANNGQMIAEVDPNFKHFQNIVRQLTGKAEVEAPIKQSLLTPLLKKLGQR